MIARGSKGKGGKAAKTTTRTKAKKSPPAPKTRGVATKKKSPPPVPARKPLVRKSTKPRAVRVTRAAAKKMAREIASDIEEKAQRHARAVAATPKLEAPPRDYFPDTEASEVEPAVARKLQKLREEELSAAQKKLGKKRVEEIKRDVAAALKGKVKRGGRPADVVAREKAESVPLDKSGLSWDRQEDLDNLCKMYREAKQAIKDQEDVVDALFANIDEIAREVGLENVHTDVWRLVLARGKSRTISRESLLEAGVDMETIEGATKEKRWEKYQILAVEDEDESSES